MENNSQNQPLYTFQNVYSENLMKLVFKKQRHDIFLLYIVVAILMVVVIVVSKIAKLDLLFYIGIAMIGLLSALVVYVFVQTSISFKRLKKSSVYNAIIDVALDEDIISFHELATGSLSNLKWSDFKSYCECHDAIILVTKNGLTFAFSKAKINNDEIINFLRRKFFANVEIFNNQKIKKNKDIGKYLK